ncbi:MAG: FRG domain-containing protein [Cyclobacteriaceae bacterium]|nr:FRG domain-containing protein [Cyclobacteriaceae bacterium]
MKTICITSFEDLLQKCSVLNQRYENNILYRGASNHLIPSLAERCSFKSYQDLAHKEFSILTDFSKYSTIDYKHKKEISRDWEIRIASREHGLVSSLMDWTNNIEIATEFSIKDFHKKNIDFTSIWVLIKQNIDQINLEESTALHFNDLEVPTIINYSLSADYFKKNHARRKFIQGGLFLKQNYIDIINPLNSNQYFQDKLIQFIISKEVLPTIWSSLSQKLNLDEDSVVMKTALDDVCKDLNSKYA